MMKKGLFILVMTLSFSFILFSQDTSRENGGREIKNQVSAVKTANPGDYIVLPSGKRYVLTKEEIDIVKGDFDYEDLSGVETETRDDGTEIKTISEAHVAYIYPDGQSAHILKTGISFTSYMKYIEEKYHITPYVDLLNEIHDFRAISSPRFDVFRASVQFQKISNGTEELDSVTVTAYNYKEENFIMKYCSAPDLVWGYVSGEYEPTGETRQIEFDIE
jgi:hypothetical protein